MWRPLIAAWRGGGIWLMANDPRSASIGRGVVTSVRSMALCGCRWEVSSDASIGGCRLEVITTPITIRFGLASFRRVVAVEARHPSLGSMGHSGSRSGMKSRPAWESDPETVARCSRKAVKPEANDDPAIGSDQPNGRRPLEFGPDMRWQAGLGPSPNSSLIVIFELGVSPFGDFFDQADYRLAVKWLGIQDFVVAQRHRVLR